MPIKVKTKLFLKDMPKNISRNFSRALKDDIGIEIINEIMSGKSPVGGKKFADYKNFKYKGRKKPVDMFNSGKMLKSLTVKQNRKGQVRIFFSSKIAIHHQEGTENMAARELLPVEKGLKFNSRITKFINKILKRATKKEIKRQK